MRAMLPRMRQQGVVLFIALIVLVAMTLAGLAMMRSVGTGALIADNMAFKQATTMAADLGIQAASNVLPTIVANSRDTNITSPYYYYATLTPKYGGVAWDTNGLPLVNWSNVPAVTDASGDIIKYVIERMCNGALPVNDVQANCVASTPAGNGSMKAGAIKFTGAVQVYYRVTVYVLGPRNATSYVQAYIAD